MGASLTDVPTAFVPGRTGTADAPGSQKNGYPFRRIFVRYSFFHCFTTYQVIKRSDAWSTSGHPVPGAMLCSIRHDHAYRGAKSRPKARFPARRERGVPGASVHRAHGQGRRTTDPRLHRGRTPHTFLADEFMTPLVEQFGDQVRLEHTQEKASVRETLAFLAGGVASGACERQGALVEKYHFRLLPTRPAPPSAGT